MTTIKLYSTTGKEIDPHGVNHPAHYNTDPSGVECIEVVRHLSFNWGSAFKYAFRAGKKDLTGDMLESELKDLKKAVWYLTDEQQSNSFWTNRTAKYKDELLRIIASREGHLKSFFESVYHLNLITAKAFILAEIQRLEKSD